MCVYGRYAPWPDVPRMLPTEQYLDLDLIDFKDFCLSLSSNMDFTQNYILANFNLRSVSSENFMAIVEG